MEGWHCVKNMSNAGCTPVKRLLSLLISTYCMTKGNYCRAFFNKLIAPLKLRGNRYKLYIIILFKFIKLGSAHILRILHSCVFRRNIGTLKVKTAYSRSVSVTYILRSNLNKFFMRSSHSCGVPRCNPFGGKELRHLTKLIPIHSVITAAAVDVGINKTRVCFKPCTVKAHIYCFVKGDDYAIVDCYISNFAI